MKTSYQEQIMEKIIQPNIVTVTDFEKLTLRKKHK